MQKITLFIIMFLAFWGTIHAQKVAIIGYNGTTNDGYSIVALETIPGGTTIYFTDKPYLGSGSFGINEGAWAYTTPAGGLSLGDVVVFTESSTNNMTMICNIGGTDGSGATCGTWGSLNGDVSLASTSAETIYAYADNNNDPSSGVTEIYAALITSGAIGSDGATNPLGEFPNAVIVDNLNSDITIDYIDFKNSLRSSVGASKASIIAALEGPASNYNQGTGNTALSRVPFTAPSNPVLTMTGPTNSPVIEDNGPNLSFVFTLTPAPSSNVTINFSVGGTASFPSDYTASGGTISGATGTIVISTSGTATLTLNPVEDSVLEPYETVTITPTTGTGYDLGGGGATGTIANDDKLVSCPLVAITGVNHTDADGFSFVALTDLSAGSFVYFTDATFNNTSLKYTVATDAVLKWTVPSGVQRGDVFVVKETSNNSNAYALSCSDGTGATCGTLANIVADFSIATNGAAFSAYADTDDDPTNGISEIYSVLYTGTSSVSGGNIPAIEDPFTVYSKAVVVDGWSVLDGAPNRTEYKPGLRNVTVSQGNFEDLSKWDHGAANADLSTTPFSNIIICEGNVNPPVTVTVSPASVDEDSGTPIVFTFTLNGPPMGDFDVSFDVSGTATYLTDYTVTTQIGNSSFNGTTGVVTIPNVTGSNTITVTPIGDSDLEPDETVILSIASGANYDAGNPGSATGTINNDDVGPSTCPLVAITGMNHVNPDGFSFVALTNIPAGTEIYFTDKPFDNNTFLFGINETVVKWTAPSGVNQGDVFFVKETAENVFSLTCNSGTCGTFSLLATEFSFGTDGDELYAYLDDDDDPENGVTEIIAALYTGASGAPGGNIPASEDPSTIYPSSILVDGFSASQPNRTEYNPAGRNVSVVQADFQNTTNWLHAQGNADLSTTAFANIEILLSISCPADQLSLEGCSPYYVILASSLPYSETAQTISEADFLADGGTINSGGTITNITYMDAVSGTFPFTVTRTFTVTDECPSTTTCEQTFIIDDTMGPNGNVTLPPLNFSCPSEIPAPDISLVTGFTDNCTATCEVWINELHYDNTGTDVGEFIEVAGPAGTDLSSYSIVYYNGANSNTYDSPQVLSGIIDNESTGFGALSFAKTGIQNGNPDGLALVKNGTNVIEFLSYGGVFTANNGPAAGMTSTDIGVTEPNTQAIGESLSRNGTGGKGIDFTFADGPQSPGDLNPLQTMTPVPCGNVVTVTFFGDVNNGGAGSAGDPLVITRTYHAQDPAGNVTPVTQTITVIDNTLPVPVCPADITVNNDSGICGANVSFSVPATDNCGTAIVTFSQNPGTIFSGGMTNVTATATDAAGNQATCSFKVTVNDNEDPDINCPANITVGNDTGQCGADVSFAATATDNCTAVTIDYSIPSGSFFPAGSPTTVTATATDATNRTASCTFTVTVNDTQAPAITCPQNITVGNTQGECGTVVNYTTPSSDNCGVVNVTYTNNLGNTVDPGSFFPIDTFTVFVRAFDLAGNNTYCRFRIEVIEDKPAVAVCKTGPVTVDLTSDGNTILNPAAIDGGSYSCGGFTLSVLPNVFNCDDVGSTVSVTLTAADNFYDVYSPPTTCMTTVTIADPNAFCCAPPDAICKPATIYLNEDGLASLSVDQINDNSTADCGFQYPMTLSEYIYTCSDMAQYIPVTLTVTDINGAVDECTTTVMVIDNIPPSIECPAGFSVNNDPGQCGALVDLPWPAYNDNCSIVALGFRSIQVDPDNGNAEIGSFSDWFNIPYIPYDPQITLGVGTWKIEWRTQDQSGLFDYCDLIITVNDNEDPAISCPISPISSGTDPGVCGANVPFNVSATDNCGDVTVVCTIGGDNGGGSGNCATNNLNLSLTFDNYPQETSWMILQLPQEIMVASGGTYGSEPDGSTLNIPINLPDGEYLFLIKDSAGDGMCCTYGSGSYALSSNGQTFAQGGSFSSFEKTPFCVETPAPGGGPLTEVSSGDFFPVGTTTVTCTATDAAGLTDVCTFDIIVNDTQAPWLTTPCPGNITLCGAQNVSWTPPAADDNCGVVSTVNNYNPGDFFAVGTYTATYTFYDAAGLSVSCSFTITINPVPQVTISQTNLPTWCQGIKVLTANVLNPQALTYPLTFAWSDGLGDSPTVIAPANGTYSVVVTDALGCSTEVSTTVNVDISTLLSAYTIISGKGLEMYESDVLGGGVGVKNANECVISQNSSILTFMRANAAGVTVDGSSFVNNFINANFNVTLPAFLSNPYNAFNNINVPANATVTLSGSNYGYVTVGAGATLIIANAQIFIKNLVTQKDATIIFNQPTEMRIRRKMSIGQSNTVNPDGYTSVIYASDVVSIGQGSVVTLSIYAPEGLNVSDSGASLTTYMTGIFISKDEVASDHHVIWNWNLNCSYLPTTGGGNIPFAASPDQDVMETSVTTKEGLNVYPNPTSGILNIDLTNYMDQPIELELYNTLGEIVWSQKIALLETPMITTDMTNLAQGVYLLRLASNGEQISQQIVFSK